MAADPQSEEWTITCQCKKTVLQAHGEPIQVAICHCADCRRAQGGDAATETLVLMRRDQVDSAIDGLKVVPAEEYKDHVPRYFCDTCGSCLVGDCTPVGFAMVIVPTVRISPNAEIGAPNYHMHLVDRTSAPADDGLPRYPGHPEDPHMAALVAGCS